MNAYTHAFICVHVYVNIYPCVSFTYTCRDASTLKSLFTYICAFIYVHMGVSS